MVLLVPKLLLGNAVLEAPASRLAKLELRSPHSQAGAWERVERIESLPSTKGAKFFTLAFSS